MSENDIRGYRRRSVLTALLTLVPLAGCSLDGVEPEDSSESSSTKTKSLNSSNTDTGSDTEAATQTAELSVEDVLPKPGDGWSLLDTGSVVNAPLNAENNIQGDFQSPNETKFRVIILEFSRPGIASFHAERLACEVEWSVALQFRSFAVGVSTGTAQKTFTPEKPPQMTRTAIPDTSAEARQLLRRSAVLSQEIIEDKEIGSC